MSSVRASWLSRLARRRLILCAQLLVAAPAVSLGGVSLWTRKCSFEPFCPDNDALFRHPFLRVINPRNNPTTHDCCARAVPFTELDPVLLEDAQKGGSALLEAFCAGMWGGYGYGIQRRILSLTKDELSDPDLWSKSQLLHDKYEPGTYFTNFFVVLDKTASSMTFRGCYRPRDSPERPRELDNLAQLSVTLDELNQTAHFRLKGIAFDGATTTPKEDPFGGPVDILHRLYAKLLVEAGTSYCVR